MTEKDINSFAKILMGIAEVYRVELSPPVIEIYFEALKKYPLELVKNALITYMSIPKEGRFFPKPVDIVEIIEGSPVDRSLEMWIKLLEMVRTAGVYGIVLTRNEAFYRTVLDLFGSWESLCSMMEDELKFYEKTFKDLYRINAQRYPEKGKKLFSLKGLAWKGTEGGSMAKIPKHQIYSLENEEQDIKLFLQGLDKPALEGQNKEQEEVTALVKQVAEKFSLEA